MNDATFQAKRPLLKAGLLASERMMESAAEGGVPGVGEANKGAFEPGRPLRHFPPGLVGRCRTMPAVAKVNLTAEDFETWADHFTVPEMQRALNGTLESTVTSWKRILRPAECYMSCLRTYNVILQSSFRGARNSLGGVCLLSARQMIRVEEMVAKNTIDAATKLMLDGCKRRDGAVRKARETAASENTAAASG